jgi:uncharacterized membrane protein YsdA (DUF1294 family)
MAPHDLTVVSPGAPAFLLVCMAGYVFFASCMTYALMGIDRDRWIAGGARISEANLLILSAMGGWPGAKLAQLRLRHKIRSQPFCTVLNLIAVGQIIYVLAFVTPIGAAAIASAMSMQDAIQVAMLAD